MGGEDRDFYRACRRQAVQQSVAARRPAGTRSRQREASSIHIATRRRRQGRSPRKTTPFLCFQRFQQQRSVKVEAVSPLVTPGSACRSRAWAVAAKPPPIAFQKPLAKGLPSAMCVVSS
jgi:hypothetical protein